MHVVNDKLVEEHMEWNAMRAAVTNGEYAPAGVSRRCSFFILV
jgi:hypothetical protein